MKAGLVESILPGVRGRLVASPRQIVRESFYVYSAVCPEMGKMTSLILPYANTEMMNIFLDQVSKDFSDYFVVMQVDQACWHKSKSLNVPENICLLEQPSHSPELNPVEHIWEEIREKYLHNRAFETLDECIDIVCAGINELSSNSEKIRSMTYFPHLRIVL